VVTAIYQPTVAHLSHTINEQLHDGKSVVDKPAGPTTVGLEASLPEVGLPIYEVLVLSKVYMAISL
jgi:hypothetical protein